jgi:hypothetical protein
MANAATNWKEFKSINPPIVINNNYLRGGASALILDDLAVIAGVSTAVKWAECYWNWQAAVVDKTCRMTTL